jgi:hypothetical protein
LKTDNAILAAAALFATVFASVIFGKELDEKEKEVIAKEKIKSKKEEAEAIRKSQSKWNIK